MTNINDENPHHVTKAVGLH